MFIPAELTDRDVTNLKLWDAIEPSEENKYCLFMADLETDSQVFFHATPLCYKDSILKKGFKSAYILGIGPLKSVSYAKKSSACLAHLGCATDKDYVVFVVKFESLEGIKENLSDIHVYKPDIQPKILGYCILNKGFELR